MENNETNNGAIAHGQIADYVAFKKAVSDEVRRLATASKSWASAESTALFVFVFDEYIAQLPVVRDADGKAVGTITPDVDDLKEIIARYVNMNAVYNRLADAKLIERKEKGVGRKAGADLL